MDNLDSSFVSKNLLDLVLDDIRLASEVYNIKDIFINSKQSKLDIDVMIFISDLVLNDAKPENVLYPLYQKNQKYYLELIVSILKDYV